jgi:hypothetical protein
MKTAALVNVTDNTRDDLCDVYLSGASAYRAQFFAHFLSNVTLDCVVESPCPFLANKWTRLSFASVRARARACARARARRERACVRCRG